MNRKLVNSTRGSKQSVASGLKPTSRRRTREVFFVLDERRDASAHMHVCICMCESRFYKYEVLMMAVKLAKEGWSRFTAEVKVQISNPGVINLLLPIWRRRSERWRQAAERPEPEFETFPSQGLEELRRVCG